MSRKPDYERAATLILSPQVADIATEMKEWFPGVDVKAFDPEVPEELDQATRLVCDGLRMGAHIHLRGKNVEEVRSYMQGCGDIAVQVAPEGKRLPGEDNVGWFISKLHERAQASEDVLVEDLPLYIPVDEDDQLSMAA